MVLDGWKFTDRALARRAEGNDARHDQREIGLAAAPISAARSGAMLFGG